MSFLKHNSFKEIPKDCEYITFGMGCFWGAEKRFWEVKGLKTTVVGYSGGQTNNPTYEKVCSGQTGHAEVVRVILDKKNFSWDELFQVFWESHDPTQLNRQGNDIGTQYRSAIFVKNERELQLAINSKEKFQYERVKEEPTTVQSSTISNNVILNSNDQMKFDKKIIRVNSNQKVTLTLNHNGRFPAISMGHNFVLIKKEKQRGF